MSDPEWIKILYSAFNPRRSEGPAWRINPNVRFLGIASTSFMKGWKGREMSPFGPVPGYKDLNADEYIWKPSGSIDIAVSPSIAPL
ncbi:MAG: hypothetical protein HKN05_02305 [Rhizobiales bacterium]|nr:hypothetical protein [Hyphomicrobiales bacterium]